MYTPGLPHHHPPPPALLELGGPAHSPSRTAKPILQSMAGNSIQAVTKDEWGPPTDRAEDESQLGRVVGGQGILGQMPTVGHDHQGHLGLIWRITGLQEDCFEVKASCRERAAVRKARASALAAGLGLTFATKTWLRQPTVTRAPGHSSS